MRRKKSYKESPIKETQENNQTLIRALWYVVFSYTYILWDCRLSNEYTAYEHISTTWVSFIFRLYRFLLPLLSVCEECRIFGVWNFGGIMHDSFDFLGSCQYCLLLVEWWNSFGVTWMLCCMLCLRLPEGTEIKV